MGYVKVLRHFQQRDEKVLHKSMITAIESTIRNLISFHNFLILVKSKRTSINEMLGHISGTNVFIPGGRVELSVLDFRPHPVTDLLAGIRNIYYVCRIWNINHSG